MFTLEEKVLDTFNFNELFIKRKKFDGTINIIKQGAIKLGWLQCLGNLLSKPKPEPESMHSYPRK